MQLEVITSLSCQASKFGKRNLNFSVYCSVLPCTFCKLVYLLVNWSNTIQHTETDSTYWSSNDNILKTKQEELLGNLSQKLVSKFSVFISTTLLNCNPLPTELFALEGVRIHSFSLLWNVTMPFPTAHIWLLKYVKSNTAKSNSLKPRHARIFYSIQMEVLMWGIVHSDPTVSNLHTQAFLQLSLVGEHEYFLRVVVGEKIRILCNWVCVS